MLQVCKLFGHRHSFTLGVVILLFTRWILSAPVPLVNIVHDLDSVHSHRLSAIFTLQLYQSGLVPLQLHLFFTQLFQHIGWCLINFALLHSQLRDFWILCINPCLKRRQFLLQLLIFLLKRRDLLLTIVDLPIPDCLLTINLLQLLLILYFQPR